MKDRIKYRTVLSAWYDLLNDYIRSESPMKTVAERTRDFLWIYGSPLSFNSLTSKIQSADNDDDVDKFAYQASTFASFSADLKKELPHVFVEDRRLVDFLGSLRVRSEGDLFGFMDSLFSGGSSFTLVTPSGGHYASFALHTPSNAYLFCVTRVMMPSGGVDCYTVAVEQSVPYHSYLIYMSPGHTVRGTISELNRHDGTRTCMNFLMYMSAFPECVRDGVPSNMVKGDRGKTLNSRTVGISDSIVERTVRGADGRVVTPHFRQGFFRYLGSDYFKKKRGQTVFVPATMVRGRAMTADGSSGVISEG